MTASIAGTRIAIAMMLFANLSGCNYSNSRNPLSDKDTSVIDERLLGHWYYVEPKWPTERTEDVRKAFQPVLDHAAFSVKRDSDNKNALLVVFYWPQFDRKMTDPDLLEFRGFIQFPMVAYTTTIREKNYINFGSNYDNLDCRIVRYEFVDKDHIRPLRLMRSAIEEDLKSGKIAGQFRNLAGPHTSGDGFELTATTEELRKYVAERGDQVFQAPSEDLRHYDFELRRGPPPKTWKE